MVSRVFPADELYQLFFLVKQHMCIHTYYVIFLMQQSVVGLSLSAFVYLSLSVSLSVCPCLCLSLSAYVIYANVHEYWLLA